MRARYAMVVMVAGLAGWVPLAIGQKLHKCPDGKGGTVFQQEVCGESAAEAEARARERARVEAEALRKREEEARRKQESMQKARERDQAYQQQLQERAREEQKSRQAEERLMQGTSKQKDVDDGTLPDALQRSYPGAWKEVANGEITAALSKNRTPACRQYRYRQRKGGLPEFLVQCTVDKANWVTYFVWPKSEAVRGPVKF